MKDKSVLSGCSEKTAVIVAMEPGRDISELPNELKVLNCYGLEAQKIAMETRSRINVVMLGAALKVMGIDNIEVGEKICTDVLGKKYPDALKGNIEGMRRGYNEVTKITLEPDEKQSIHENESSGKWGYKTAPIGGINPRFGSTVIADVSPSRQGYIPLFIKEKCINCGQCHTTCPDMVFQFVKGEYKGKEMMVNEGLDYYHCKGCLRCVDVCPVNALVRGVEAEHPNKDYFMTNLLQRK